MLLYNVTIILDETAEASWLEYMRSTHIPEVLATGKFLSNRLLKVIDSPNEGVTYCSQYVVENMDDYNTYQAEFAPALQQDLNTRFENQFVAFRSLMEYID